jgi:ribulose-phosphate 3-epimerase
LPLDVHLMIEDPDRSLADYREAGADALTVHVEACPHLHRTLQRIRELGARAGVSLNPATPISSIERILDDVDLILVMSVNPGFGGQRFIDSSYQKLRELSQLLGPRRVERSVDGGVKVENCRALAEAGATTLVVGSAIFGASDPADVIRQMRTRLHDLS